MAIGMVKKRYVVTLTEPFQNGLDSLVKSGLFMEPQDVIRESLRELFQKYGIAPFKVEEAED